MKSVYKKPADCWAKTKTRSPILLMPVDSILYPTLINFLNPSKALRHPTIKVDYSYNKGISLDSDHELFLLACEILKPEDLPTIRISLQFRFP